MAKKKIECMELSMNLEILIYPFLISMHWCMHVQSFAKKLIAHGEFHGHDKGVFNTAKTGKAAKSKYK